MFQQIILVGNLGADPEMRYTPSGVPVTSFAWQSTGGRAKTGSAKKNHLVP